MRRFARLLLGRGWAIPGLTHERPERTLSATRDGGLIEGLANGGHQNSSLPRGGSAAFAGGAGGGLCRCDRPHGAVAGDHTHGLFWDGLAVAGFLIRAEYTARVRFFLSPGLAIAGAFDEGPKRALRAVRARHDRRAWERSVNRLSPWRRNRLAAGGDRRHGWCRADRCAIGSYSK